MSQEYYMLTDRINVLIETVSTINPRLLDSVQFQGLIDALKDIKDEIRALSDSTNARFDFTDRTMGSRFDQSDIRFGQIDATLAAIKSQTDKIK